MNPSFDIIRQLRRVRQHAINQFVSYAEEGYLIEMKRMIELEHFMDTNECINKFNGYNALMIAVLKKHYKIVKYLLSIGADIYHETSHGYTAVYYSRISGNKHLERYLIKKKNYSIKQLTMEQMKHVTHKEKRKKRSDKKKDKINKFGKYNQRHVRIILSAIDRQNK